ncbi:hypothetical protein Ciccas_004032 [Cichlidogyrus casuarinus]|uniref:Uncharacterized protein n=1 Tax=Cichlidogyrus casuarinus TaxID=1844966 RepID=A0ABD2QG05_9PLAT
MSIEQNSNSQLSLTGPLPRKISTTSQPDTSSLFETGSTASFFTAQGTNFGSTTAINSASTMTLNQAPFQPNFDQMNVEHKAELPWTREKTEQKVEFWVADFSSMSAADSNSLEKLTVS